jgi:hypothetical protein
VITWIEHLRQKWNDWCGDREMELAIRKQLTEEGFYGATSTLRNVRLVAVQRPGWLQLYRFEATARVRTGDPSDDAPDDEAPDDAAEYVHLYGLVKDDIRYNISTVSVFDNEPQRRELFEHLSEDLIRLRGSAGLL